MEAWRQYGGINKPDNQSRFTVGTLVADEILLRQQTAGEFRIQGTATIEQDLFALANLYVDFDTEIKKDLSVNNLSQLKKLTLGSFGTNVAEGNQKGWSLNHNNAIATLDMTGYDASQNWILRAKSTGVNVNNIIAETIDNRGVIAGVNAEETYLEFFSQFNPATYGFTSEAKLMYTTVDGGKFKISTPKLEFGDTLQNIYLYDAYEQDSVYTGRSLQLKSSRDSSSNTFMIITGLNGEGLTMGGGLYPKDTNREYSFIGIVDASDNLYPNIVSVRSERAYNRRIHTGINTYDPRKSDYLFDINGRTIISYGEVTKVYGDFTEPNSIILDRSNKNYMAISGSPRNISQAHEYAMFYSEDAGKSWATKEITENEAFGLTPWKVAMSNFLVSNAANHTGYHAIAGANNSFYSTSSFSGKNGWNAFTFTNTTELDAYFPTGADYNHIELIYEVVDANTFPSSVVSGQPIPDSVLSGLDIRVIFTQQTKDINNNLINPNTGVINAKSYLLNLNSTLIPNLHTNNWGPQIFIHDAGATSTITGPQIWRDNIVEITSYPDNIKHTLVTYTADEQSIWCAGLGLVKINNDSSLSRYTFTNGSQIHNATKQYNRLFQSEIDTNYIIAVGNNVISTTKNGGETWTDKVASDIPEVSDVQLNGVYILDLSNAMIVGEKGTFIYTIDGTDTWVKVPNAVLDGSGTGERIYGESSNLLDIYIEDTESMVITKKIESFVEDTTQGQFYIYYLTIPSLFNFENVDIFDVCGNSTFTGDIILDRGDFLTRNTTCNIINDTATTLNMGADLLTINMGRVNDISGSDTYQNLGRPATRTNYKGDMFVSERFSLGKGIDISNGNSHVMGEISAGFSADVSGNIYQRGFMHQF
jgi:hypothetical protein